MKYNEIFIYIFIPIFGNSPTAQTRRRIFTLDGSNDADSRNGVPFGGFVDIAPHFGGEIHQNPNIWDVNRRFQAKREKLLKVSYYRNYFIYFDQILRNDRDHQLFIVGEYVPPKVQDGGRPPF